MIDANVQAEPATSYDPELAGQLAAIGIVKSKDFAPDDRMKKILTDAAAVGSTFGRALNWRPLGVECISGYTVDMCVNYYNSLLDTYDVNDTCEAAATSYFNCAAGLSCDEFVMDPNGCTDEFNAIFDVCFPL